MKEFMMLFKKMFTECPEKSLEGFEKFINILLEIERDEYLQRGSYERKKVSIEDYRNGYKPRKLNSRFGTLKVMKPQTRKGFTSEFFGRYQHSEQAIMSTCAEMYLNGVSTRKVSKLVENVFGVEVSASTISNYTKQLDEVLAIWRNLPLNSSYKYLYIDATYIKVRENHKIVSKGVYIAIGVSDECRYRVLGFTVLGEESDENWGIFFEELKARGLSQVDLIISDKHKGLLKAVNRTFLNSEWQRCIFHFKHNFLSKMPKKLRAEFNRRLDIVLMQLSKEDVRAEANLLIAKMESMGYSDLASYLEEAIDEIMVYKGYPESHWKRIRTTNKVERLNQEIKRRTKTIRIYPNVPAAVRSVGYILKETDEKWMNGNKIF
ncbi:MAG: hypothetical protein B6226_00960 [Candidatus Cloacimonetes bacterium 4572_65]|nr:MAG: hypothetical protein B6226_00960 [Candidatus Cloacimonetes bacterium 4572_65]